MYSTVCGLTAIALLANIAGSLPTHSHEDHDQHRVSRHGYRVSVGVRPFYIINNMTDSLLKRKLEACENNRNEVTGFSIGHRGGGTLQFPEETVESTM